MLVTKDAERVAAHHTVVRCVVGHPRSSSKWRRLRVVILLIIFITIITNIAHVMKLDMIVSIVAMATTIIVITSIKCG